MIYRAFLTSRTQTYPTPFPHKPTFQASDKKEKKTAVGSVLPFLPLGGQLSNPGAGGERPSGKLTASSLNLHLAAGHTGEALRGKGGLRRRKVISEIQEQVVPQSGSQQIFIKNLLRDMLNHPSEGLTNLILLISVYKNAYFLRYSPILTIKIVF